MHKEHVCFLLIPKLQHVPVIISYHCLFYKVFVTFSLLEDIPNRRIEAKMTTQANCKDTAEHCDCF